MSGACKEPNGAACSAPGQCQSNACTTFYRDADSDTFGNAAAPAAFCGTAPPSGYVADHTDCCDSDANAKPGQSAWFTTLDKCGSWDYDCDGGVEYEYSGTGCNTISSGCPYCSYGTNVWSGSVPSCGNPGTWVTNCTSTSTACSPGSSYCTASGSSRTQACH